MYLAQGMQYWVSDGGISISYGFPDAYIFLGTGSIGFVPMPIVMYLLVFAIIYFITERTPIGRYFKATGLNQFTAALSGINIKRYTFLSYVIAGVLASILGLILGAFQHYISPTLGDSFLMDSLMVALLGKALFEGRLTMQGTAFGAIFLRSFETGLAMLGIPTTVLNISKGILLVAILLVNLAKERKRRKN
jgi:simple sugar transport system permease protein